MKFGALLVALLLAPWARGEVAAYDKLVSELAAPCCWKEPLALHRSSAADEARLELRTLVDEGRTEREIRAWFVSKYGERVLLTPEGGKAQALFWVPIAAGALALLGVGVVLRRWASRRVAARATPAAAVDLDDSEWDW